MLFTSRVMEFEMVATPLLNLCTYLKLFNEQKVIQRPHHIFFNLKKSITSIVNKVTWYCPLFEQKWQCLKSKYKTTTVHSEKNWSTPDDLSPWNKEVKYCKILFCKHFSGTLHPLEPHPPSTFFRSI